MHHKTAKRPDETSGRFAAFFLLLCADEILVEIDRTGQAAVLDVFVDAVHPLHLLRAVDHRRKAHAAVADLLIEVRICRAGHDIGTDGQPRERLPDDALHLTKRLAVNVHRFRVIVRVHDLHLQTMLFGESANDGQALLLALVRNEAQICAQRRLLRQDIVSIRTGLHGERDRRAQHGPRLCRHARQHNLHQRRKQPEVAHHEPQAKRRIRRQPREHGRDLGQKLFAKRRVALHIRHERGQAGNGGVRRRGTGVAAGAAGRELHVRLALFKHADHGEVSGDAADRLGDDAAALVADEKRPHSAALELIDELRRAVARPLFRAGRGDVNVICRFISGGEQLLDRLEKRHDRALGVRRAAAPDLAIGNIAGKRCVLPRTLGGHDILMAHEHDRTIVRLARPIIEQVAVDVRARELFMHEREELRQQGVEALELLRLADIGIRRGVAPDHGRELLGIGHGALGIRLWLIIGRFARRERGVHHGRSQRGQRREREITGTEFHFTSASFFCLRYIL